MLIINSDFSDPDVIRVDDTFFLTASSFNFVPGLPILESHDLRNWRLINYALKKISLPGYEKPQHGKGVWAPAIRQHDGVFYIFFATPDEGIFEIHTTDIRGEWSEMNCVWSGKGFIDPCPFWDDDGKFYIVHAYAKSRIGFNSKLGILCGEDGTSMVRHGSPTEVVPEPVEGVEAPRLKDRIIFDGTKTQPTIEGPKVYKRNDFYYILAPAGGVTNGWQTALRSKNIFGPYEEKIVMAQGSTNINGPHQGALFDDAAGGWHFVHFQDKGIFGRVTHLERAGWKDDWVLLGTGVDGAAIGEPEEEISAFVATDGDLQLNSASRLRLGKLKSKDAISTTAPPPSESGLGESPLDWQTLGNTEGLSRENQKVFPLWENPFVLTRKITEGEFDYSIEVECSGGSTPSRASGTAPTEASVHGIIFLGDEYAALCVDFSKCEIFYLESEKVPCEDKNLEVRREKIIKKSRFESLSDRCVLSLHFTATPDNFGLVTFSAEIDGEKWTPDTPPFKTKNAHWVGGRVGKF